MDNGYSHTQKMMSSLYHVSRPTVNFGKFSSRILHALSLCILICKHLLYMLSLNKMCINWFFVCLYWMRKCICLAWSSKIFFSFSFFFCFYFNVFFIFFSFGIGRAFYAHFSLLTIRICRKCVR